jgi:hypothetical protein
MNEDPNAPYPTFVRAVEAVLAKVLGRVCGPYGALDAIRSALEILRSELAECEMCRNTMDVPYTLDELRTRERFCFGCGHAIIWHEDDDGGTHECTHPDCACLQFTEAQ